MNTIMLAKTIVFLVRNIHCEAPIWGLINYYKWLLLCYHENHCYASVSYSYSIILSHLK